MKKKLAALMAAGALIITAAPGAQAASNTKKVSKVFYIRTENVTRSSSFKQEVKATMHVNINADPCKYNDKGKHKKAMYFVQMQRKSGLYWYNYANVRGPLSACKAYDLVWTDAAAHKYRFKFTNLTANHTMMFAQGNIIYTVKK